MIPLRLLRAGRAPFLGSLRRVYHARSFSQSYAVARPPQAQALADVSSPVEAVDQPAKTKRASRKNGTVEEGKAMQVGNAPPAGPHGLAEPLKKKRAPKRKTMHSVEDVERDSSYEAGRAFPTTTTPTADLPNLSAKPTRRGRKALSADESKAVRGASGNGAPQRTAKGGVKGETLTWDLGSGREGTPIETPKPVWSDTEAVIHAETQRAMDEQRIPSSPLAESVYKNYLRFPGCIVLTRVGKFYESYYDAALHLTSIIDIKVAVKRNNVRWADGRRKPKSGNSQLQFPFAGFPYTQIDKYLKLLVQDLGHTVVLVEEDHVSDKNEDGLVKRAVGRVVTPGTLLDESWLSASESRYLLAISVSDRPGPMTDDPVQSVPLWLAYTDVSTGEFFSKDATLAKLEDELTRIGPREVVLDRSFAPYWSNGTEIGTRDDHSTMGELFSLLRALNPHVSFADTYLSPEIDGSPAKALDQAILDANLEAQALSLLRHYVQYALREYSPDLSVPQRQFYSAFMHIDAATLNGLEIKHSMRFGDGQRASPLSAKGTLLSVFDRTVTPAGHRLLVRTLSAPSTCIDTINHRLDLVQAFVEREDLREEVQETLKPLKDVVKLYQRVRQNRGDVDDIYEIALWIDGINRICDRISLEAQHERDSQADDVASSSDDVGRRRLTHLVESVHDLSELSQGIQQVIDTDVVKSSRRPMFAPTNSPSDDDLEMQPDVEVEPELDAAEDEDVDRVDGDEVDDITEEFPVGMPKANQELVKRFRRLELAFKQQWWIKPSGSPRLQELHDKLAAIDKRRETLEQKMIEKFNVPAKDLCMIVNHERIGWKLLVSKASDRAQMTNDGQMRTFGGGQYAKFLEHDAITVLGSERERVAANLRDEQMRVYKTLRSSVVDAGERLLHNASQADELDLTMGFAHIADDMGYVRPTLTDGTEFKVVNGRHPVVEAALHSTARLFVPNSNSLTPENHLHVITGPNQGGKSTFLRQTAVIAILAQSGSFVPADEAEIGIVDQLFSRIGARDDLFRDRSTFMLEMVETAAILRYATKRSLVIMDEIGRGTTLQAGMAIAYATLDYILGNIECRTLFATHYHELETMLKETEADGGERVRHGVVYWCTDVDEADGAVSYSYRLKPGVNYDSRAILAARLAGMPPEFIKVAKEKLASAATNMAGR